MPPLKRTKGASAEVPVTKQTTPAPTAPSEPPSSSKAKANLKEGPAMDLSNDNERQIEKLINPVVIKLFRDVSVLPSMCEIADCYRTGTLSVWQLSSIG